MSSQPEMIGNVPVFGERGRAPIARAFVEALGRLTPTQRRLALARACALPWRDKPSQLPDCYKRELEAAEWEAREEDRGRGRSPHATDIDSLLDSEDLPISELFLRQLIPLRPSRRRSHLAQACIAFSVLERRTPPQWISRFNEHAHGDAAEDYRLDKGERASA